MNILLFDMDGVLIEDGGYYAALVKTLDYFCQLMGANPVEFDSAARDDFHARGYVNEWDLCPLCAGILMIETLAQHPHLQLRPAPFEEFMRQFRTVAAPQLVEVAWPYLEQIDRAQGKPAERARDVLLNALAPLTLREDTRAVTEALLREMFAQTHDVERAPVTQIFQEFVIGSKWYAQSYHLPPRFDVPSVLITEDRSLISAEAQTKLATWVQADRARICVYTARPSLPPADDPDRSSPSGYSPEAELGMQLLHMDFPLIATGRVQWLAAKVNVPFESVTKPAPIQALAAIGAAITREEANSLLAAHALTARGALIGPLAQLKHPGRNRARASTPLHSAHALSAKRGRARRPARDEVEGCEDQIVKVWIVEDGILGLQATHDAIEILRRSGIAVHAQAVGIARGGPKAAALAPLSKVVLPDVNEAIGYIESEMR